MLEIRFSKISDKKQLLLPAGHLYIMNKEPLLIQGDLRCVKRLFQSIQSLHGVSFWQEGKQIDDSDVGQNMCLIDEAEFPAHAKVRRYLEQEYGEEYAESILSSLHIQVSETTQFRELSRFQRNLLNIKLELSNKPKLMFISQDAQNYSEQQIETLKTLFDEVLSDGCYILMQEQAERLLDHETLQLQDLPQTVSGFYLEESLNFHNRPHQQLKKRHGKEYLSLFLRIILTALYSLSSLCLVILLVMMFSTYPIKDTEATLRTMDDAQEYPVLLWKNSQQDLANEYAYNELAPYTEEELQIIKEYEKELPLYPIYKGMVADADVLDMVVKKDGTAYTPEIEKGDDQSFHTYRVGSYNEHTLSSFLDTKDAVQDTQTIYISKFVKEELFKNVDIDEGMLTISMGVPVYCFELKGMYYSNSEHSYDYLMKKYTFEAQVHVLETNMSENGILIPEQIFLSAYDRFDRFAPYDEATFFDENEYLNLFHFGGSSLMKEDVDHVQPYEPNEYMYIADQKPPMRNAKQALSKIADVSAFKSTYESDVETLSQMKAAEQELQMKLYPTCGVLLAVMLACAVAHYAVNIRSTSHKKQKERPKKLYKQLLVIAACAGSMLCVYIALYQPPVINGIISFFFDKYGQDMWNPESSIVFTILSVLQFHLYWPTQSTGIYVGILLFGCFCYLLYQMPQFLHQRFRRH